MANLASDVRFALRLMRKRPGVTAAAVLTLAIGTGANTAIFSVVNAVLIKPLPYASADRLVHVSIGADTGFGERTLLPMADFLAWQSANRACEMLAAYTSGTVVVSGLGDAEQVIGTQASAQFFAALGVTPALGRLWRAGDDRPGAPLTVVVSYPFWERRLNADAAAIGRTLMLDGRAHVIIGVAPKGFAFPRRLGELWSILPLEPPSRRGPYFLRGLGLMHPNATIAQIQTDLRTAETEIRQRFQGRNPTNYRVEPLKTVIVGDARPALLLLVAAVAVVLLVAILNVANLLLARAAEREREIAVRTALGAGRARITRQLVTEGLVLGLAGTMAGWIVATWATRVLVALAPANLPRLTEIQMDLRVFGFTLLAAVVSGVFFGVSPSLQLSNRTFVETIQAGVRSSSRPATRRFRNALIVAEIALALALAINAALLARSLIRLQQVEVGFNPEQIVTASITPPAATYPGRPRVVAFFDELLRRIEMLPGVSGVALTNSVPPDGLSVTDSFVVEDRPPSPDRGAPVGPVLSVSNSYFRVLQVPLIRGRWFGDIDAESSTPVVIVSAALATRYFGGVDPIGRRMKLVADWPRPDGNPWLTVVGVAGDVKYGGLAEPSSLTYYLPLSQAPFRNQNLVVRVTRNPSTIVDGVRDVLRALDPNLPLAEIRTMEERLRASSGQPRFRTWLMALFGVMGLTLAAIGIYGVMAYSVTQRTREIGVRAALGATRGDLMRMVLSDGLKLAMVGACLGLALALASGRIIAALLFATNPTDVGVLAGATGLLMFVAAVASLLPARRAGAVDPIAALRAE